MTSFIVFSAMLPPLLLFLSGFPTSAWADRHPDFMAKSCGASSGIAVLAAGCSAINVFNHTGPAAFTGPWLYIDRLSVLMLVAFKHGLLLNTAAFALVIGAVIKSAQFPFHSGLPEVMETPTPVSALMHAGGFLMIRMSHILVQAPAALHLLAVIGTLANRILYRYWPQSSRVNHPHSEGQLVDNRWLHLPRIDPLDNRCYRYLQPQRWQAVTDYSREH